MPHKDEIDSSEEMRRHKAKELGLSEEASWEEVVNTEDEHIRISSATVLGLPETASWEEIHDAENGNGNRISQALILGLDRNAGYAEIVAEDKRRTDELHKKIWEQMRANRGL